jgi:hypothetical protein
VAAVVAGVVAGVAAATATDPEQPSTSPALIEVRAQLLLIGSVRLALSAAGLAAAIVLGARSGGALFAAGAVVVLVAVLGGRRGRKAWVRLANAERLTSAPRTEPRRLILARAAYPSTIGLTFLIAMALVLEPGLAALLSGILAGIGGAALGFAAQLAAWERQRGATVLVEPRRDGRVFEAPK